VTAEGPMEPPLRLSELAAVDSPDVVRAAFRRFRRRVIRWAAAIVAVAIAAAVLIPVYFPSRISLEQRIHQSSGVSVGATIHQGRLTALILEVVRLDKKTFGLHVVVTVADMRADQSVEFANFYPGRSPVAPGTVEQQATINKSVNDLWITAAAGSPVVPVTGYMLPGDKPQRVGPLQIDMQSLHIPALVWR
jgi:hypothetical protein